LVKEQTTNQARCFFNQEAVLQEALGVVRKAEEAANKKLHETAQTYTALLAKVVPLHEEIVELKDTVATSKTKMTSLEERCVTQEVKLGKVEADLVAKNETFDVMKAEFTEQVESYTRNNLLRRLGPWQTWRRNWLPKLNAPRRSKRSSSTMPPVPLP